MYFCFLGHFDDFLHNFLLDDWVLLVFKFCFEFGVSNSPVSNIILERVVEQDAILRNDCDLISKVRYFDFCNILAVNQNLASRDIVKSVQESHNGGLSSSCRSYQSIGFSCRNCEGNIVNYVRIFFILRISKAHISELNRTESHSARLGILGFWNRLINIEQFKDLRNVNH